MSNTEIIKKIREQTGAGIVDIKKALDEADGDEQKTIEILRKQGEKIVAKKQAREAGEGLIEAYVHAGGKVGVLLNLACETDFVARNDEFKELAHDIAMQIAATDPQYLARKNIPETVMEKEKDIYREELKSAGKTADMLDKIVEGKLKKFYSQVCLLHQPFIKDEDKTI